MAKAKAKSKSKKSAVKAKTKKVVKATKPAKTAKTDLSDMFVPLDDRVLVEPTIKVTKTPGGLFLGESNQEPTNRGTVVCVGPGHKSVKGHLRPTTVKNGEQVLFAKFAGTEIKIGNDKYVILRETDIIGVLEK